MQLEIEAFVSKCSALQNDDDGENKYSDDLCQHVQFCFAKGIRVLIIHMTCTNYMHVTCANYMHVTISASSCL